MPLLKEASAAIVERLSSSKGEDLVHLSPTLLFAIAALNSDDDNEDEKQQQPSWQSSYLTDVLHPLLQALNSKGERLRKKLQQQKQLSDDDELQQPTSTTTLIDQTSIIMSPTTTPSVFQSDNNHSSTMVLMCTLAARWPFAGVDGGVPGVVRLLAERGRMGEEGLKECIDEIKCSSKLIGRVGDR